MRSHARLESVGEVHPVVSQKGGCGWRRELGLSVTDNGEGTGTGGRDAAEAGLSEAVERERQGDVRGSRGGGGGMT